jgi:hypothetical protein
MSSIAIKRDRCRVAAMGASGPELQEPIHRASAGGVAVAVHWTMTPLLIGRDPFRFQNHGSLLRIWITSILAYLQPRGAKSSAQIARLRHFNLH